MPDRILSFDGCTNVRDLGGLRTRDGRVTRRGAVVRADTPARLSAAGWAALYDYGIRTIVTLRTDGLVEEALNFVPPYADIHGIPAAIEDISDAEFVRRWVDTNLWGTPLYYRDALERWPERHAAAVCAVARAGPGGVLFHCIRGCDRTGIIALLLLALVGVAPEEIAADYALSPDAKRDELLARAHSSVQEAILGALDGLDVENYLRRGGAREEDLAAVREKILGRG